jgi:hypothetical protein
MRVHGVGGPLAHEELAFVLKYERGNTALRHSKSRSRGGQRFGAIFFECYATPGYWTNFTPGLSRSADQRPQFHQRLIQI